MFTASPALVAFRDTVLRPAGFDVRLVGGCVRDILWGTEPKDIDLCTDANPDQQMALYEKHGVIFYTTGLAHGTVTINLGPKGASEIYEITSLRTETDHDGRWATVSYTRDWNLDLGRRDLTVNAMSANLEFDQVYDPFEGRVDMKDGRIRFVGRPEDRIREDYLRILRWFRFHARFVGDNPMDEDTANAVSRHAKGLEKISRERVWSEVSKIVSQYAGWDMLREMMRLGVAKPCSLPHGSWREVQRVAVGTKNPVTRMCAFLGSDRDVLQKLSQDWRWSGEEARLARFLCEHAADEQCDYKRMLAHDNDNPNAVRELLALQSRHYDLTDMARWVVPKFPMKGEDLIKAGLKPSPKISQYLAALRSLWTDSGYEMTKDQLLSAVAVFERNP